MTSRSSTDDGRNCFRFSNVSMNHLETGKTLERQFPSA